MDVIRAEVMMTETLVQMNASLSSADLLNKTIKKAFANTPVGKKYSCARSKTTAIVRCLAETEQKKMAELIGHSPYCISTDGSNDQRDKQYPVVLTFVGDSGVETRLFSVPFLKESSTGENIFKVVARDLGLPTAVRSRQPDPDSDEDEVEELAVGMSWNNCLALGCDNAPVMTGATKGVYGFMRKHNENIHLAGCPCHLLHRAAEKACEALPFSIDEILIDVFYYQDKSSKHQQTLAVFQDEEGVEHTTILKHVSTRWLSIRRSLQRMLENWEPLKKFVVEEIKPFKKKNSSDTTPAHARLKRMNEFFSSRTNKLYCLFIDCALEPFDILNQQLQNESPQVHILHRMLVRFLRQCLIKFVRPSAMTGKTALQVEYSESYQLKQEKDVYIGEEATQFLQDHDLNEEKVKQFRSVALKFWKSAVDYMKAKLPYDSKVLICAKVADVKIRAVEGADGAQLSDLEFFISRFPCLLPPGVKKGVVSEEFMEYQVEDLTSVLGPGWEEEDINKTWVKIRELKDEVGNPRFKNLASVMLGILTIPHSNAACERVFSCVRKNKTEQRASLGQKTLESLMVVKSIPGEPHEREYTASQLKELKSAYYNAQKKAREGGMSEDD